MSSIRDPGRVAGVWYLLLILIGPLRLIYIPGRRGCSDGKVFTFSSPARWGELAFMLRLVIKGATTAPPA